MKIDVVVADYSNKIHAKDIGLLLNSYATDPMGGSEPLSPDVMDNLVSELAKRPYAMSVLCYADEVAAGLTNCFETMSTFTCKPIINIHDIIVEKKFRGKGLSYKMLQKVQEIAISRDCSKLSLEVLENNIIAKSAYEKFGFSSYDSKKSLGRYLFMQKELSESK